MSKRMNLMVALPTALSIVFLVAVSASGEPADPIPAARQAKLLEKFGDQGIDGDGDGVLTHAELETFFTQKHGRGEGGRDGCQAGKYHGMKKGRHPDIKGAMTHGMDWEMCHGMKGDMHHGMIGDLDYGKMTEEQRAQTLKHHPEADADGDGALSEAEFESFRSQRMETYRAKMLERHPEADTDDDGTLSEAEFEAFRSLKMKEHRAKMLERHPEADTNGDGTLSDEEAEAFVGSKQGGGSGCGFGPGHGRGGHSADKKHGECSAHQGKERHGWAHDKDQGHGRCSGSKGKDHGSLAAQDDKVKDRRGCPVAKGK